MREARAEADRIRLTGIAATGYHGVLAHERRDGQTFVADVVLHLDTRPAAAEDRLDRTVDYGVLAEQVAAVLAGEPADLVETVAERVAAVALAHGPVAAVDVVLHKPQAPITVPFTDVAVEIHRDRVARRPAVPGPPFTVTPDDGAAVPRHAADPADDDLLGVAVPAAPAAPPAPAVEHASEHAASGPVLDRPLDPVLDPALEPVLDPLPSGELLAPAVDRLDQAPSAPVDVVLALGSNVGSSRDTLRTAISELAAVDGLQVTAISPLARTAAVGGPEQPDFLNVVVLGRTTLAPRALLRVCQEVEALHGRERAEHWGPRTLDVDIVLHGSTIAVADDLELPHPRAHERAFVLEPWAQVAPDAVLPGLGGGPVADLARTAPDRAGIRWMALDWWQGTEAPR